MHKSVLYISIIAASVLCSAQFVQAEEGYCGLKAPYTDVSAIMKHARGAESAGHYQEALTYLGRIDKTECPSNYNVDEFLAMQKRVHHKLGEQAEKKAHYYPEAANHFHAAENFTDEDRVMLKYAKSAPTDIKVFSTAFGYFDRDRHNGHSEADVRQLKSIATNDANIELNKEAAAFAKVSASHVNSIGAIAESRKHLQAAQAWFRFIPEQMTRLSTRAVQRGDKFAAEDNRESLRTALDYYDFAQNTGKAKSVRDKARRLGDAHAKKGETLVAVDYYRIAGAADKADALDRRAKQKRAKVEKKRQRTFKKESNDLEKELGL